MTKRIFISIIIIFILLIFGCDFSSTTEEESGSSLEIIIEELDEKLEERAVLRKQFFRLTKNLDAGTISKFTFADKVTDIQLDLDGNTGEIEFLVVKLPEDELKELWEEIIEIIYLENEGIDLYITGVITEDKESIIEGRRKFLESIRRLERFVEKSRE